MPELATLATLSHHSSLPGHRDGSDVVDIDSDVALDGDAQRDLHAMVVHVEAPDGVHRFMGGRSVHSLTFLEHLHKGLAAGPEEQTATTHSSVCPNYV